MAVQQLCTFFQANNLINFSFTSKEEDYAEEMDLQI
jgi:hypothetical protein